MYNHDSASIILLDEDAEILLFSLIFNLFKINKYTLLFSLAIPKPMACVSHTPIVRCRPQGRGCLHSEYFKSKMYKDNVAASVGGDD